MTYIIVTVAVLVMLSWAALIITANHLIRHQLNTSDEAAMMALGKQAESFMKELESKNTIEVVCPCHQANKQRVPIDLRNNSQHYTCNRCNRTVGLHMKILATQVSDDIPTDPFIYQENLEEIITPLSGDTVS